MSSNYEVPIPFTNKQSQTLVNLWWTGLLLRKVAARVFKETELSEAKFNILRILHHDKASSFTQNALSRRLLVDKSNITGLIDKLEDQRLVKRKKVKGDRRSYNIILTKKGREITERTEKIYLETVNKLLEDFSQEEMNNILQVTRKLRKVIDKQFEDFDMF